MKGFLRRSVGPGWALVGDAGYFRDPITAHGITDALRDAELLAISASAGDEESFARYQDTRDTLVRRLLEISDRLASFDWDLEEAKALHRALSREMAVARWAIVARTPRDLGAIADDSRWRSLDELDGPVWTDDYSNVLSVLQR